MRLYLILSALLSACGHAQADICVNLCPIAEFRLHFFLCILVVFTMCMDISAEDGVQVSVDDQRFDIENFFLSERKGISEG